MTEEPADAPLLRVEVTDGDPVLVVAVGELDPATTPDFEARLAAVLAAAPARVALDLAGVTFIDSAGIRAIVQTDHALRERGASLQVLGATANARRIFTIVGIDDLLA